MPRKNETIVSILGDCYSQPIADLLEKWLKHNTPKSNAVGSGYYDHAYGASVILLLVAMFESYIVRVRYIHAGKVPDKLRNALEVLFHIYPNIRNKKALTDIYVVRDSIFHNHLWEIEFSWEGTPSSVLHGASKHPAFGDKKYLERVNPKTRKTKALGLSVVPTRVNKVDARKVFETLWKTLLFLQDKDMNQCLVSNTHVRFRGKNVLFGELVSELQS